MIDIQWDPEPLASLRQWLAPMPRQRRPIPTSPWSTSISYVDGSMSGQAGTYPDPPRWVDDEA